MRNLLLGAVAGVLLVSTPVLAGPLQINGNLSLFGYHNDQHINAHQSVENNYRSVFGYDAVQLNANVGLGSTGTQSVTDNQNLYLYGPVGGTQAVQAGVNVSLASSTNQSIVQNQSVAAGYTGSTQATQVGVNVAAGSIGGSQTIHASQSVH